MDFAVRSKTEGLTQTGPNLDRDQSGPFSGTDGLGSVRSTDLRSVFGLPYQVAHAYAATQARCHISVINKMQIFYCFKY